MRIIVVSVDDGLWFQFHPHLIKDGDPFHPFFISCFGHQWAIIPNLTRNARPYGLIENVVTHPDFRRRGIGTQILHAALELAWAQDCYKVMLLTSRKDEATLRFYQQAGFEAGVKTGFVARR